MRGATWDGNGKTAGGTQGDQAFAEEGEREKMNDVVRELWGNCEAEKCKRAERGIYSEADLVLKRQKTYHQGCEPTDEELEATDRSSGANA